MFDTTYFPGAKRYWHNGQMYDWQTRQVHVMSHVLHYGSSVFEGIRAYETECGPAIFRLPEHIDRFFYSASVVNLESPYTKAEIMEACRLIVRENRLASAYIRPNLFFGYGNLGLTPKACPAELTVGAWEWGAYLGAEGLEKGVHVILTPYKRFHPSQINASVKLGGLYVQSNIYATEARRLGYDECIFLNLENRVAEGAGENIIIVKDGMVITNDRSESILEGITRTTILELAEDLGYPTRIAPITVDDFLGADEVFFTGTAAEVTPITRITDSRNRELPQEEWPVHVIGEGKPGPLTLQLAKLYSEVVRGMNPNYEKWLTYAFDSKEEAQKALNGKLKFSRKERITKF